MMRCLLVLLALTALPAFGQSVPKTRVSSALLGLSASTPTVSPLPQKTDGTSTTVPGALRITGCQGYRITVCAPAPGDTITAVGTVQIYYWSDYFGTVSVGNFTPTKWPRNKLIDETVPSTTATDCNSSTCSCVTFPDRWTSGPGMGWIYPAPNSFVTAAGASTVRVILEAVCLY